MPKTDEKIAEIILDHLRHMRGDIAIIKADISEIKTDVRFLRKRDVLQDEETAHLRNVLADMRSEIDRIKARLDLTE